MFLINDNKRGLNYSRVYFCDGSDLSNTSGHIVMLHGKLPVQLPRHSLLRTQETLLSNLALSDEELLASASKGCRYDIRRATKDGVEFSAFFGDEILNNLSLVKDFSEVYKRMFDSKGLDYPFNEKMIYEFASLGHLMISLASFAGETLVYHAYLYDSNCAELYYSTSVLSEQKKMGELIGRANKGLHFADFGFLRNAGVLNLDWGGINSYSSPNGIARFKMSFGGSPSEKKSIIAGTTLAGRLALRLMQRAGKLRGNYESCN